MPPDNASPTRSLVEPALPAYPGDFDPTTVRGGSRGVRLAKSTTGQWWWVDAEGAVGVCRAIAGVDASVASESADTQASRWGFDLLIPPWAEAFAQRGAPHVLDLGLSRINRGGLSEEGVILPDVFDPSWEEAVDQVINGVKPTPQLVGWFGDLDLKWGGWASDGAALERPGLLQVCLGMDPSNRAYHAAWEFVLARHAGELARISMAWGLEFERRGQIRELTRQEKVIDSPAYRRDLGGFLQEYSQRYFTTVRRASRRGNKNCLLFSQLVTPHLPPQVLESASRHCDVLVSSVPGISEGSVPEVWMVEGWTSTQLLTPLSLGESNLEAIIRNGREWLSSGLRDPAVVGYVWPKFQGGDLAADDPFTAGLVDENGRVNTVLTQPLTAFNAAAAQIRAEASA